MIISPDPDQVNQVQSFLDQHTARLRQLLRDAHLAYWDAATSGEDAAAQRYAAAEAQLRKLYSDAANAARVREWLAGEDELSAVQRRELKLLDLEYTGNQLPTGTIEDLSQRVAELDHVFHTFRATLHGTRVSNNRILEILRAERDSDARRLAWEASKQIGRVVEAPLRELVRRRNAAARSLGFANFYVMKLVLQEQDEDHLFALVERFRAETEEPFGRLRDEVDRRLAERYGVAPTELRPWHWEDPFGQEAPSIGAVDLDGLFEGHDPVALMRRFFAGIGLPVDEVLDRSDLWEREGKAQHAFAIDIDREGDVRVLCNLRPNEHWAMVLLHELGHAVYDKFVPRHLPFIVRTPAHTLSTEAIAMLMGRLTRDPRWLREVLGATQTEKTARDVVQQQRLKMLMAARWMLVMIHFERELYRDAERDDLNDLWWGLVEQMQLIRRPEGRDEPDWAAKIHLSTSPVYYHNYLLGEWMASQLSAHLAELGGAGEGFLFDQRLGEFLSQRVFAHGAMLDWNALLVEAMGEGLNPRFFVDQFVAG